jgi:hypothetical protein
MLTFLDISVGKSAITTAITAKLFYAARKDPSFNLLIIKNRPSSIHSKVPFNAWRQIIVELCRSIHKFTLEQQVVDAAKQQQQGNQPVKTSFRSVTMKDASMATGFKIIIDKLPKEMQLISPIIAKTFGIATIEENDFLKRLDERSKLMRCAEVIAVMVTASAKILKKMIILLM